jgi:hypothetical protein
MTGHANMRVARLRLAGLAEQAIQDLLRTAEKVAADNKRGSVAVKLADLPAQVGRPWADESNGDAVWAVIRGGKVVTLFLRRGTQPVDVEAFRVDRLVEVTR